MARTALLRFAPEAIPSYADLRIDTWVILFNVSITLLAPLLFGIGPALSVAGADNLRHVERIHAIFQAECPLVASRR